MPRMFTADRWLSWAFILLALTALMPLFLTSFIPLHDLPDHVGLAALMGQTVQGDALAAQHYDVHFKVLPYWSFYLTLSLLTAMVGPFIAAKLTIAVALCALPLSVMRLLIAFRRSPRLGLLSFALVWDHNMAWGFVAFMWGLALAFWALAIFLEEGHERRGKIWVIGSLCALTHAHAFAIWIFLLLVTSLASEGRRKKVLVAAKAMSFPLALLSLWVFDRVWASTSNQDEKTGQFVWHDLGWTTSRSLGPGAVSPPPRLPIAERATIWASESKIF